MHNNTLLCLLSRWWGQGMERPNFSWTGTLPSCPQDPKAGACRCPTVHQSELALSCPKDTVWWAVTCYRAPPSAHYEAGPFWLLSRLPSTFSKQFQQLPLYTTQSYYFQIFNLLSWLFTSCGVKSHLVHQELNVSLVLSNLVVGHVVEWFLILQKRLQIIWILTRST